MHCVHPTSLVTLVMKARKSNPDINQHSFDKWYMSCLQVVSSFINESSGGGCFCGLSTLVGTFRRTYYNHVRNRFVLILVVRTRYLDESF
jgi:hypothetical protein